MAIVSRNEQDPEGGNAPKDPEAPAPERRHNLPLKAAPVIGRKPEMQRIVQIFEMIRKQGGRPRRVEIVGPPGVGASTLAVELARRAGHRFPGGAWYVNLGMGADVAWATLGALRGSGPVKDLAAAARAARERLGEEPKALLVLDGANSADEVRAALPPEGTHSADVFVVAEKPLGTVDADQVCEVSPVPRHGARRIAQSMLRLSQPDGKPPAVRSLDGLAVTASLAARAALAFQGKEGPISVDDANAAMQRMVRLVARNPVALELLLLASVAHPVAVPVDALLGALVHVRQGRGAEPTDEEAGTGVTWLAHAGIMEPMDERHFSMHPMLQAVVHTMTKSPADLEIARASMAAGLIETAEEAVTEAGVDLLQVSVHQLRFLAASANGETRPRVAAALAKVESALGAGSAA